MKLTVCRKEFFNAAHRLHSPVLSEDENKITFGKCNYPNYHGHNYELTVKVRGELNPVTGYVIDMKYLSTLIKTNVIDKFDHKNLNLDVPEFENLNPTAENIIIVIHNILRPLIDEKLELFLTLNETEKNFVEFP